MDPSNYEQLQGKRNARAWKRQFKVAALGKGVWDVFTGIYTAAGCPDPKDYGLEGAQQAAKATGDQEAEGSQDVTTTTDQADKKGKRKARATVGPDEINELIKQAAATVSDQKTGMDFSSRMTLYKFTLDEYDKGRKIVATAMALLITWVHPTLRGQLENFLEPKDAYDHLVNRYSVTDARAREMAESQFNSIYVTRYTTAQDYINAIENAQQDILEAGGYCDDPMMISKIVRGLRGHPMYKDFATQYHLLRDIDPKFEDLDHVITQLLTFESSNFPEPDFRPIAKSGAYGNPGYGNARSSGQRNFQPPRERCTGCGIWGHAEDVCRKTHPELRPQNNGFSGPPGRSFNPSNKNWNNASSGNGNRDRNGPSTNNFNRGAKPNGMAAAAVIDNDAFTTALKRAQVTPASSLSAPKGTTPSLPAQQTHAKDFPQAISLGGTGRKGELDEEEGLVFEGEGVQDLLSQGVVFNTNNPNITLRNNTSVSAEDGYREDEVVENIDSTETADAQDTNFVQLWNSLHLTKAFYQMPLEDVFNELELLDVENAIDDINEGICLATSNTPVNPNAWILDSGANVYVCNNASWFTTLYTFGTTVSTAGQGSVMNIVGGGTVELELEDGDNEPFKLTLSDVAYAPTSRSNLMSISKLADAKIRGCWDEGTMYLLTREGYTIGKANLIGGLYHLKLLSAALPKLSRETPFVANVDFTDPVWKEHRRLGHLSLQRMIQLCAQSIGMNVTKGQIQAKLGQICPVCATTRAIIRVPRDPARIRYDKKGQLVHVDIWGPYPVAGWDGTKWMVFSTDDATRATKTLRLRALNEFPQRLRELHKAEERKHQIIILRYRVDNQFNRGPWKIWCEKKGIAIEPIAPYAHHQVGVAERVNRTLREGASAMIQDNAIGRQIRTIIEERGNEFLRNSTLPEALWPEAVDYAAWLKNRTPTRAHKSKKTPWELEEGNVPDLSRERTWGSRLYVSYTEEERGRKLHDPRGWLGYFVGCENESTYRVWDPSARKVKRVAYTIVEDGQGLDDTQDGQNVNDRITRQPLQPLGVSDSSSDEDALESDNDQDDGDNDQDSVERGQRSRFFPRPAAMVTQRNDPRKGKAPGGEDIPLLEENMSPISPYEDTYVPPIGNTLGQETSSRFFKTNLDTVRPTGTTLGQETSSHFFKTNLDTATPYDDEDSELSEHDDEEFGEFQGSNVDGSGSIHSMDPAIPMFEEQPEILLPPIPVRNSKHRTANQLPIEDTDSDDEMPIRGRRNEANRGTKQKIRVPDRQRCQRCFDHGTNCRMGEFKCAQCFSDNRKCEPLQLGPSGELPLTRRYCQTPVDQENMLAVKCYRCDKRHKKCDAAQPINHRNPCTNCKIGNAFCQSIEQHERAQQGPPCLYCKSHEVRCDRGEPCDACVTKAHPRCTYESADGTRWITTLTNPVAPEQGSSRNDANIDRFDPSYPSACTRCVKKYHGRCDYKPGGPPCERCFNAKGREADRCRYWPAPGKNESIATRMFKMEGGEIVRDPTKTNNLATKKRPPRQRSPGGMSTSASSSESDFETARARIMTEESRAATRQKLMEHTLPDAFLTAFSLAALRNPVDMALQPDPQSYSEAMKSPDSQKWMEAIQAEYDSLIENGTWKIAVLPAGRKALTTKWVLKKKLGPNGEVLKYKARMVARGFQQVEGYDYTETYSGVVKAAAYRLLFALMILNNWTCHQMDVSTAFLNGDVLEEIYIHPPQGYPHRGKVFRLLKALYGLKQSPRLWYRKLRQWLVSNGWEISKYDECVFYNEARQLVMTVYVDDINIFGPSDQHIVPFKENIGRAFQMTDAGRASWYLGMQLQWMPEGLHIHQNGFIQQALGRYGLLGSNSASIPLDPNRKLIKETEKTADPKFKTAYMSMVGSLNYLQTKTVWGLAFPVSLVSRYMTNPNQTHMDAVQQQFRYLSGSPERGLFYRKDGDPTLRGFVDSDWGGDTETGKSTTGWVFTLAGCPVSWSSQRQKTVSSSSTEAEYIAASDACKEAIWLKGFHNEIAPKMGHPDQMTIPLAIDNASALKLTKNPEFHGRTKHINIRHHFIRECVEQGEIAPEWISGKTNPADLFTKALARPLFFENVSRLGGGMPVSSTSSASKGHERPALEGEQ